MSRPVQGQAPPWGNDLNGWLDVGHNAAGATLLPITETTGWAEYLCDQSASISSGGGSANLPLTFDDGGNPGGPQQGDATLLDFTAGLDAPALTSSGVWTMTVWYAWIPDQMDPPPSAGALAYAELFAQVPAGATYWDTGVTFPMDPATTTGTRGSASLTAHPTYMEVGTVLTATLKNGGDQKVTGQVATFWITKLSDG